MDLTVSRPIKILVLVLVIAGIGGIASMSVLGKSSPAAGSSAPLSVAQVRARAHHAAPTAKTPATKTAATANTPAATTPAAAAPVPKPAASKPPAKPSAPKPKPTVAANGLPTILMEALHQHRVVVVSLFDPHSQTDSISYAEARAGAAAANVGFLGVSVLDDTVSAPLTAALPGGGLLPTPGLLFYRGSGTLVQRVDGFADRDAVAQLATAARTAEPVTVTPTAPAVVAPPAAVAAPVTTTP